MKPDKATTENAARDADLKKTLLVTSFPSDLLILSTSLILSIFTKMSFADFKD